MPVIPQFDNSTAMPGVPAAPRIDPNVAGGAANAVAQGGAAVASQFDQWNQQYITAKRGVMAASAVASGMGDMQKARIDRSRIADRDAAFAGFNEDADAVIAKTVAGVSDPLVASHVMQSLTEQKIALGGAVQQAAFGLEASSHQADWTARQFQFQQSAATAPNDLVRAQIVDQAVADTKQMVAGGWIRPEEGQVAQIHFNSGVQEVAARSLMNSNVGAAVQALADPASFPGMQPEKREVLLHSAMRRQEALMSHADAMAARADARAERELRLGQEHTLANIYADTIDGNAPDPGLIAQLGRSGMLSAAGMVAAQTAIRKDGAVANDPMTALRLTRGLGDGTTSADDIAHAVASGQLTTSTALELQKGLNTRATKGDTAIDKANENVLDMVTGLHAQTAPLVDIGHTHGAAIIAMQAEAKQEWNRRVRVNGEDSATVLADMLPRFQAMPTSPAYPAPMAGTISSADDVPRIAAATVQALRAGKISEEQARQQGALIQQWQAFYQYQALTDGMRKSAAPPPAPKVKK